MNRTTIGLALLFISSLHLYAQTGKISGKLTYPSDYIPPEMVLCVQNMSLYAEPTYCSDTASSRLRQESVTFKVTPRTAAYTVTLPPGRYYVYATFRRGRAPSPDMAGTKAYYNEFVRCGMSVNCRSKRPIEVVVRSGRTTTGITVGDWY